MDRFQLGRFRFGVGPIPVRFSSGSVLHQFGTDSVSVSVFVSGQFRLSLDSFSVRFQIRFGFGSGFDEPRFGSIRVD